jgi:hypothetical protein
MQPKHLALSLALSLASSALFASTFEGTAHYKSLGKGPQEGSEMDFSIKGDKFRVDMSGKGHEGSMIMDSKTHQAITLMPERKSYLVMKLDGNAAPAAKAGKLTKTGRTETIAGYAAEEWVYESAGRKTSLWGNQSLGGWAFNGGASKGPHMDIPAEFKDGGLFPLRMTSEHGGLEATKVESKSLSDSLFEVPAGYKLMEMGSMRGDHPPLPGGAAQHGVKPDQQKAMMDAMQNMTPEQRAMFEKLMKGKGGE